MRARSCLAPSLGSFLVIAACQALPSSIPLSHNGGVLEDTGTERDRRPQSADRPALSVSETRAPASASPPAPVAALPSASAPDAGAPDAALTADGGVAQGEWPGEYYGSDKLVRRFDGENDDVELDDKAHTRVEERSQGVLVISIVNSATGDTICALKATASGSAATIDAGQSCFGGDGADASVTDGHATITLDRLVLDFAGKVVVTGDEDGDPDEFRLDYHFDGRRR